MVNYPPANAEDMGEVRFLGQEDPLEKEMPTHSSILAWGIPWTEAPGGLQSMGSDTTERLHSLTLKVYKVFKKVSQGPWLRGDCALGLPV